MVVSARLTSGACVDADFSDASDVGEARGKVAEALGVGRTQVRLLDGVQELDDSTLLESSGELTAVLLPFNGPSWYPVGKYIHNQHHVLNIEKTLGFAMRYQTQGQGGLWTVHYVERGHERIDQEVAEGLIERFGFRKCITYGYTNWGANEMAHTYVPQEDEDTPEEM
mmetsp:Transcript_102022/g.176980  ORF Transcript_102022/g.176980 Transcript_102022/m.176980 type:complete len:168 (-) Transcript_102022:19-522(-)